jgi:hypothetical protein
VFSHVALDITRLHLCNTSSIILIDNDKCFHGTNSYYSMWFIILRSQTHSREASYSAMISE